MSGNSKPVTTDSLAELEDILEIAKRFRSDTYLRPIEDEANLRQSIIELCNGKDLILDAGCGVGESTYHLASMHKDSFILGVDKSIDRIERKNFFKKELPPNMGLITADMQSVWPLLLKMKKDREINLKKQYILYPNPWPKKKALKKRWHANPMITFILDLDTPIELRSNWRQYLEEFKYVATGLSKLKGDIEELKGDNWITPFERKYSNSGQVNFKLELK